MAAGYKGASNWWDQSWVTLVQPYVKNIGVFRCPSDSLDQTSGSWVRAGVSYSANALVGWTYDAPERCYGALSPGGDWVNGNPIAQDVVTAAMINRPADTILIAERHNGELQERAPSGAVMKTGNGYVGSAPFIGANWMDGWFGYGDIPDGRRSATAAYPYGREASVSARHSGMANFVFCDGHVKAMKPADTNPNASTNPEKNLWNAARR
jgi:prepilin-type processing-associated H-X9-DG protein